MQVTELALGVEVKVAFTLTPSVESGCEELLLKEHSALEKSEGGKVGSAFLMVKVTVDIPVMSRSILCPGKKLLTPMVKGAFEVTPASKLEPKAGLGKYSFVA